MPGTPRACPAVAMGATLKLAAGIAALSLAGCHMLPRLEDVEPATQGRARAVVDAGGALMSEHRARIDASMVAMRDDDFLARHSKILETINGMPARNGNHSRILIDGPLAWEAMFAALQAARDHIHIESFIFEDLDFGPRLSDLLIERQKAGVDVRIVYDSVGSLATPAAVFERLRANGIAVCEFNPVSPLRARIGWRLNHRDHRKIVIVDGRVAYTGGINFHSVYRSGSAMLRKNMPSVEEGWRDTHVELKGPAVRELQTLFLQTWDKQSCEARPAREFFPPVQTDGAHTVAIVGSSPDGMLSRMYLILTAAITYARESVWVTAAYFAPDPNTIRALKAAAQRGVDVRLLLPGFTDSALAFHAGRSHYDDLLASGVRIYERRDALLHAKTAVIDGVWSTIGSSNTDWRSFCHNDEVNALFLGTDFAAQMRRVFEDDLTAANEVTLREWRERGNGMRVREWLARQFDYYL